MAGVERIIHEQESSPDERIEVRIRGLLPSFTPAERRVAEQVLADPAKTVRSTINELAASCGTSLTTVTRFCRALGLAGYAELRLALATEAGRVQSRTWTQGLGTEITLDDPLERVLASLVETDTRAIEETASQLDLGAMQKAVMAITGARRIDIYAVSGSAAIARDLHLRLHHIGCSSYSWSDVHEALGSATLLGPADVALGISHSGQTREVIEPLELARRQGAATIAITNFPRSPLAAVGDIVLTTAAREVTYRSGGLSARHAQFVILDCLYIGVAQRSFAHSEPALAAVIEAVKGHRVSSSSTPAAEKPEKD